MAPHRHLTHVDDVAASSYEHGELRATRRRLGAAAGARGVGLSRYDIPPGARNMPVHVHGDEEELFYVLAGAGLSWQDGRTHRVGPGDCIAHRSGGEAHALLAGPEGLSVLAFAEGSRTHLTWLPRAQVLWAGPHWVPVDAPHPFAAEAAAGPLDAPEPEAERPPGIVGLADVEPELHDRGAYAAEERDLGTAAGSARSGLRHNVLPAGRTGRPPHWHTGEEEVFVVLDGDGHALLGEDELEVRAGSVLVRPPATRVAHALRAGRRGMTYLAYGTRVPADLVYYPRSAKVGVGGVLFRVEPVGYWDGEE
jgi:uncharacterized cupin superfamily protein